ncbi:hypothetical protein BJV85_002357 [Clostridium acetobutylicum]|uniref:GH-E family nuclease n=4 Tax=Clostridiaceae TaxID=31979 RepID=UPI000212AA80|nr:MULTISPECIES: GH-E family nuclease [Clostridium]AEI31914.1 hypothetical protein SMB_G1664 [Clostridium acetobutylicum DSM 1731]AWV79955.1 hypothetical protein DK921_07565 [Clostridium acetobutylicum]MBC2394059.1 hypothetical protein [Clostridium acetobutylicum]NOV90466.1 hypothetical protein [Clostridium acetobutylicum]NOW15009.1 hypothetical protein [Clostridium acetobutylicum]
MSNSELYYEELTDLSVRIALGIKNRTEPLDELSQAMTQLSQTNAIKGNAANAMKAYINEVHMTLIQTLELLLNNYEMALGKYVKGYLEVDSDESFKLIKEDFDAHKNNLSSHQSDFTSIGNKLKAISDEAEDIISLRGAGSKRLFNVAKDMGTMKEIVSNLNNKWNDYEQSDPGFNQVQDLIAQTTSLLKSTLSVPRGYSYSPGSFSKLISKDFVNAFEVNANYAQNPDNQKAFKANWNSISKNYTTDQKRMAEEAKEEAQKDGRIGLIWDALQVAAGTVLVVTGVGAGFGVVLIAGGINSAINHASMATTGNSFNIMGNLTNGALQWYNKNIGEPLVKTGNPVAKFVAGLGDSAIQTAGGVWQFSVYDTGKAVYTLATNPEAQAQVGKSIGNWWNQIRSGNAYVIGQTTGVVASVLVAPGDIGAAAGKASKAESLLGKVGTFSKSVAVSSAKSAKNIINLPGRTIDNLRSKFTDLSTALGQGNGIRYAFQAAGDDGSIFSKINEENIEHVDADKICEDRYAQWIKGKMSEGTADANKIKIQKPKAYSNPKMRPKYGKNQVKDVWNSAKDIDGKVYDPNTGEELSWDTSKSRAGQWDMGHTPENKYSEWHKKYIDGEITKKEFLEWYRNPNNYRPESPSANRSHKYE